MPDSSPKYIPGTCNIGKAEIQRRWLIGWTSLAVLVVLWACSVVLGISPLCRLLLFFPAMFAAIGFLQAGLHFCAKFGLAGVFNLGPNVGMTDTVEQAENRKKDRRKALAIIGLSLLAGGTIAAVAYFGPR